MQLEDGLELWILLPPTLSVRIAGTTPTSAVCCLGSSWAGTQDRRYTGSVCSGSELHPPATQWDFSVTLRLVLYEP